MSKMFCQEKIPPSKMENGYKSELTGFRAMKKQPDGSYRKQTSYNQERNHIFRVRTKVDGIRKYCRSKVWEN